MSDHNKIITLDEATRDKLRRGVNQVANIVKKTLGPKGRNVAFSRSWGNVVIANDGVTIAREIFCQDETEDMGAYLVKSAASRTNDQAGDGTTTAIILTQAIVNEGLSAVESGANPMILKRGLEKALASAIEAVKKHSVKIKGLEHVKDVATISANNDKELGQVVASAFEEIGAEGVVTVEEDPNMISGARVERVSGLRIDTGLMSPYFITNRDRLITELDDCLVLVTPQRLGSAPETAQLFERIIKEYKMTKLVLIAEDFQPEVLATCILNVRKGAFFGLPIRAPGAGERKHALLEDIATVLGCEILPDVIGAKLSDVKPVHLGRVKRVVAGRKETMFIGGVGSPRAVTTRAKAIKEELKQAKTPYERDKLKERLAGLQNGISILHVGATTEEELKEKKYRLEDAINATRAALEDGIVAGGGIALFRAAQALKNAKNEPSHSKSYQVLANAMEEPLKTIVRNAAGSEEEVVRVVLVQDDILAGWDAMKNEFVPDTLKSGIIDPLKVVVSALTHAVSIGGMILTAGAGIAIEKEKDEKKSQNK